MVTYDLHAKNNFSNFPVHVKHRMIERSLYNPRNWKRFLKWWKTNLLPYDSGGPDEGAAFDEVDRTLSYTEAVDEITSKHPEWFRNKEKAAKVKQIVFIKSLLPRLISSEVRCTYRNRRFFGSYYVVTSRFKHDEPCLIIEVTNNEPVKTSKLTDEEARLAGIDSSKELEKLLHKWYGRDPVFRNWLTVKQVLCDVKEFDLQ
jgi:hypothetical protein